MPAMSPSLGLHTPAAITTASASMSPPLVRTRRMRPSSTSMPTTSTLGTTVRAPDSIARSRMIVPARSESTTPTPGCQKAPMNWSSSMNGTFSFTNAGSTISASIPHARALDMRRRSSSIRSSVAGDLEAAGLREDTHLLVLLDRVEGEVGDLPGVVGQEDEVRRVPGRPAGVGQRALVDLDDVGPAEACQVVHEAVADDAGADDDDLGGAGDGGHVHSFDSVASCATLCVIRNKL
jgi:hypothetical protein